MGLLMSADEVHRVPSRKGGVENAECKSSGTGAVVLVRGYLSPWDQVPLD